MDTLIIFIAKYLVFVSAAIAVFYFLKQPRQKQKEILIFAVVLLPLSYIVAKIVSHFYFDPRPFVVGHFTPLLPHAADNGFPSDHTLFGAAVAFAVFHFPRLRPPSGRHGLFRGSPLPRPAPRDERPARRGTEERQGARPPLLAELRLP